MCPLENSLCLKIALRKGKEVEGIASLMSFLVYFYCGLGVTATKQLQVSLNISPPLIHDISC